jgi:hypothetical protein
MGVRPSQSCTSRARNSCSTLGAEQRTPGRALAEFRLPDVRAAAAVRPQAVGADQRDAVLVGGGEPLRQATLTPLAMHRRSPRPRAEAERDVGIGAHRVEQRGLQVGAMDRPVGRAVAAFALRAERMRAPVCCRSRS